MDEKSIILLVFGILGYVACFFFGYYLCRSRGLASSTDLCREISNDLERDGKQVGDIQQSIEDVENRVTELTDESQRALDIFRKYLIQPGENKELEQDSDRRSSSEPDVECSADSPTTQVE